MGFVLDVRNLKMANSFAGYSTQYARAKGARSGHRHGDPAYVDFKIGRNDVTDRKLFYSLIGNRFTRLWKIIIVS